jgi:hypothetical protein
MIIPQNIVAKVNALTADGSMEPDDEFPYLLFGLTAEATLVLLLARFRRHPYLS